MEAIERPTSTEARRSQNSALQTAKEFLNGSEYKTKKPEIETPVGEPQQELDWDGLQEPLSELLLNQKNQIIKPQEMLRQLLNLEPKSLCKVRKELFKKKNKT